MSYVKLKPYLMILPVVLLLALFIIALMNGLVQSLGVLPAAGLTQITLSYYREVLSSQELMASLLLSLYISLVSSLLASILSLLISAAATASGLVQSRFFPILKLPVIVPHTVTALLMLSLFSQSGMMARLTYHLYLIQGQEGFPSLMFTNHSWGIILAYLWKEVPFITLVIVTIMAKIDLSLGEAAINLGATRWQTFRQITIPLCLPAAATSFLIVFAYSFGAYELPYLLGPTVPRALPVQAYIEYTNPDLAHRPYAMVLNVFMIGISVLLTYLYYRILQGNLNRTGGHHG